MTEHIVVIGGGFAGVTAARNLSWLGYRVTLLEARDRLGGRTHRRTFLDTDVKIETGGAWFAGELQTYVHREIRRYGLEYKPDLPVQNFGHLVGDRYDTRPMPIAPDEYLDFERGSFHIMKAAQSVDRNLPVDVQPLKDFDITWADFLGQVALPPAMLDFFDAWGTDACGGPATSNSSAITHLWHTARFRHSLVSWATFTDQQLEFGTTSLLDAMIADGSVAVRLETPVASVEQSSTAVRVQTHGGEAFDADGVVVAVPVNCWPDIEFDPPLNADKQAGAALRPGGRGVKSWALVEGAPPGFYGWGNVDRGHGLTVVKSQGQIDGHELIFSLSPVGHDQHQPGFDPLDKAQVQKALEAYIPGAKVLAVDAEDWNVSPWSNGSWTTYRIGQMDHLGGMRRPEGRLTFAGSDIARGFMTWIDGAIESGHYAAAELDRIVSSAAQQETQNRSDH